MFYGPGSAPDFHSQGHVDVSSLPLGHEGPPCPSFPEALGDCRVELLDTQVRDTD